MYRKTVYLYMNEILHDIDAELLKFSKLIAEDGAIPNQELQTDETMNNRPLMLRRVTRYVNELYGVMQAYILHDDKDVSSNAFKEGVEHEINLVFPDNWQSRTFGRLPREMHDYVVNSCIADFLKSAYPRESGQYKESASENYWNVKHCVTSRVPESIKKPQTMF